MVRWFCIFIVFLLAGAGFCKSEPNDANSSNLDITAEIPDIYSNYAPILENYVNKSGLVNYAKLRRRRLELLPQMLEFENFDTKDYDKLSRNEKIAFWINAYNFYAINLVVKNYPIKSTVYSRLWWPADSIKQVAKFYDGQFFKVIGIEYTLDEIERDILLKQFNDPRICFALCKATLSSPPLRNEPYIAEKLDAQLDDQIKQFLKNKNAFDYSSSEKILYLPDIFDIHARFFISNYADKKHFRAFEPKIQAVFNFIAKHGNADNIEIINRVSTTVAVEFVKRNWRYYTKINDAGEK